jgi:hypothetical protein
MGAGSAKGSRPLALMNTAASPASSLAGSTSAKSAQRAKPAVAPRMPPLLPRDITAGGIQKPASMSKGSGSFASKSRGSFGP